MKGKAYLKALKEAEEGEKLTTPSTIERFWVEALNNYLCRTPYNKAHSQLARLGVSKEDRDELMNRRTYSRDPAKSSVFISVSKKPEIVSFLKSWLKSFRESQVLWPKQDALNIARRVGRFSPR